MQEKFNNFQQEIQQLNEQTEKNKKSYEINRRDDKYVANKEYENYDDEIINGESIFDCQIENVKRQSRILSLYNEMIEKCKKVKNEMKENPEFAKEFEEIIGKFEKELKEQQKNSDEINSKINNLNQIVNLEFNKETKEEREEIEKIKKEKERFINEFLQFEINFVDYKKCELKKEQKVQIENWTKMKMKEIIFDSNIHNWEVDESEFNDLILNKQNLLFLIETDDNIKFGGFISSKINKIEDYISDENAFVFTFKDNKPMKFDIRKDKKDYVFLLIFQFHHSSIFSNHFHVSSIFHFFLNFHNFYQINFLFL